MIGLVVKYTTGGPMFNEGTIQDKIRVYDSGYGASCTNSDRYVIERKSDPAGKVDVVKPSDIVEIVRS